MLRLNSAESEYKKTIKIVCEPLFHTIVFLNLSLTLLLIELIFKEAPYFWAEIDIRLSGGPIRRGTLHRDRGPGLCKK